MIRNKVTSQHTECQTEWLVSQISQTLHLQTDRISTQNLRVTQWDALRSSSTTLIPSFET